jgi:hypothetical protein
MDNFDFIFDDFTEADFKKVSLNPFDHLNSLLGRSTSLELWHGYGDPDGYIHGQEIQLGKGQL